MSKTFLVDSQIYASISGRDARATGCQWFSTSFGPIAGQSAHSGARFEDIEFLYSGGARLTIEDLER
jgi:hypothetical protein